VSTAAGEPTLSRRLSWATSDVAVMTHRYVLALWRVPSVLAFALIQPVMFVLLFRYVFGGAIHVEGLSYVEYMIPGAIAQTAAFASFGTAIGLNIDASRGLIERVRAMPTARLAVLLGRLTADTLRSAGVVAVLVAIGYVVGFRFEQGAGAAIGMMLLAVAFGLAICCIAASIGLSIKDVEAVQGFGLIWIFPLTFVSAAFVPVQSMPGWLQAVARPNPVTLVVASMRALSYPDPTNPLTPHLLESMAWIAGILAVFLPLAVRSYQRAG
jgi:ABC-2 type transport system permease protein/oleandomycin transport system permease protein